MFCTAFQTDCYFLMFILGVYSDILSTSVRFHFESQFRVEKNTLSGRVLLVRFVILLDFELASVSRHNFFFCEMRIMFALAVSELL